MIEVKNLTKHYSLLESPAVKDVSFCAKEGKITILLGPNGAGKSTTIKSIVNLLNYQGEINICGYPNSSLEAKKSFGYVPEVPVLYDLLTVDETIHFIGKSYRLQNYGKTAEEYL
ncbi:MAG: ATP-binding cassette domain-containing protein, partial [Blautia hansenii]